MADASETVGSTKLTTIHSSVIVEYTKTTMASLIKCVFGPRLYRIHNPEVGQGLQYEANGLESFSDTVIKWFRFVKAFTYWTSPVILTILYRKSCFSMDGIVWMSKFVGGLLVVYYMAIWFRGIGRLINPIYMNFIGILEDAQISYNEDTRARLRKFDCEFGPWPVDFRWDDPSIGEKKPLTKDQWSRNSRGIVDYIKGLPCDLLSYIAIHTFGRRMVYPGSTSIQILLGPILNQGRSKLVEEKLGERAKLLTEDGNEIDTMFVDRRKVGAYAFGRTLVITSEGNAGFYEIGSMITPLEAGYSVLGWNHPGFAGSTGIPFPMSTHAAIDVIMQYAIHRLGFFPEDIVVFAWSIGGFPASFAAMSYPEIKHVVLDATFDHLLPIAVQRMPTSWRSLVNMTIRKYMNLNNAEQLVRYPGPILLIRRSRDEMITTQDPAVLKSNRGNDLLIYLLQHRYPKLVCEETLMILWDWLSRRSAQQVVMEEEHGMESTLCHSIIKSYVMEHSHSFPCQIGADMTVIEKTRMLLFLAGMYMTDYESTHGTPLPAALFRKPWTPEADLI